MLEDCALLFVVEDEVFFILLKVIQPPNCVGGWGASVLLNCQDWSFWVWNFCHPVLTMQALRLLHGVIEVSVRWLLKHFFTNITTQCFSRIRKQSDTLPWVLTQFSKRGLKAKQNIRTVGNFQILLFCIFFFNTVTLVVMIVSWSSMVCVYTCYI